MPGLQWRHLPLIGPRLAGPLGRSRVGEPGAGRNRDRSMPGRRKMATQRRSNGTQATKQRRRHEDGGLFANRGLHNQVVNELGQRIVWDEFGATGLLPTEPNLAAELGVRRNVLREAVKVLVGKGLIEVRPKTGYRI